MLRIAEIIVELLGYSPEIVGSAIIALVVLQMRYNWMGDEA